MYSEHTKAHCAPLERGGYLRDEAINIVLLRSTSNIVLPGALQTLCSPEHFKHCAPPEHFIPRVQDKSLFGKAGSRLGLDSYRYFACRVINNRHLLLVHSARVLPAWIEHRDVYFVRTRRQAFNCKPTARV